MMRTKITALLVLATLAMTAKVEAQFEELTRLVPGDANVLVLINHEDLMASPLAKANNWDSKYEEAFASGVASIPPGVEDHILAGSIDLELGAFNWEMAIVKDKDGVTPPEQIAKMFDGRVETIAGTKAIVVPGDTYLVQFGDTVAGGISPSNRQKTSRWIRGAKGKTTDSISEYLETAANYANKFGVDIVMSVDLQDAIPEAEVDSVAKLSDNPEKLSELLKTIKGVTLGINVKDAVKGKILVDFGADASAFKANGKKMVLAALGDFGVMVDDVKDWKASVAGTRFMLEGELSEMGMRRILAFSQPSGFSNGHSSESMSKEGKNVRYIQSVLALQSDFQDHESNAIHLHSAWLNKTIEKIDSLSVVDVDDELTDFAADLTDGYRAVLDIIAEEDAHERIAKANVRGYGYGYRYRGGRYRGTSNTSVRKAAEQRDRAEGARQIKLKLNDINKMVRDFKTDMSKKYERDF